MWINAIYTFYKVYTETQPLRDELKRVEAIVAEKMAKKARKVAPLSDHLQAPSLPESADQFAEALLDLLSDRRVRVSHHGTGLRHGEPQLRVAVWVRRIDLGVPDR